MSEEVNNSQIDGANSAEPSTPVDKSAIIAEYMQSKDYIDAINAAKGKAVESFKSEKLPELVSKEIETRSKKTPEQIKFEEYENKLAEMQNKIREKELFELRSKNKEDARSKFKEAELPDTLLDYFVSEDVETTNKNVEAAVAALTDFRNGITRTEYKNNNIKVPGQTVTDANGNKEPGPGASKDEWKAYWKKVKR